MRTAQVALCSVLLCCGCRGEPAEPGWLAPPDSGSAPVRFEDYFAELAIRDSATGQRGYPDQVAGFRFSRKAMLQLSYVAHRAGTIRVAVTSRSSGEAAGVWYRPFTTGSGLIPLGQFPRDLYLLQAYINRDRIAAVLFASE